MLPTTRPDISTKATQGQILQALASLAGLPSRQADDAALDHETYFIALDGVSRYALSEAVRAVLQDRLGHGFFPSPQELRRLCNQAVQPILDSERRASIREQQRRDNREFDRIRAERTPEAIARQQAAYRSFQRALGNDPDTAEADFQSAMRAKYGSDLDKVPDRPASKFDLSKEA